MFSIPKMGFSDLKNMYLLQALSTRDTAPKKPLAMNWPPYWNVASRININHFSLIQVIEEWENTVGERRRTGEEKRKLGGIMFSSLLSIGAEDNWEKYLK